MLLPDNNVQRSTDLDIPSTCVRRSTDPNIRHVRPSFQDQPVFWPRKKIPILAVYWVNQTILLW